MRTDHLLLALFAVSCLVVSKAAMDKSPEFPSLNSPGTPRILLSQKGVRNIHSNRLNSIRSVHLGIVRYNKKLSMKKPNSAIKQKHSEEYTITKEQKVAIKTSFGTFV